MVKTHENKRVYELEHLLEETCNLVLHPKENQVDTTLAITETTASLDTPKKPAATASCPLLSLPPELQVQMLTFLRAFDLAAVHQTCRFYAQPSLMSQTVRHAAEHVYPKHLTSGFEAEPVQYSPTNSETLTYEHLRNMEFLIVARVLSQPEAKDCGEFVVSKAWCKTALLWLESMEHRKQANTTQKRKKKVARRQQRRLSDAMPPWPDMNADLLCEHLQLKLCSNQKSDRARKRMLKSQDWNALRRLFPESTPLVSHDSCWKCQQLEQRQQQEYQRQAQQALHKKQEPIRHALQAFFSRHGSITMEPCQRYCILPKAWCQRWRKYMKTSTGERPVFDPQFLWCARHSTHRIPPGLWSYLQDSSVHDQYAPQIRAAYAAAGQLHQCPPVEIVSLEEWQALFDYEYIPEETKIELSWNDESKPIMMQSFCQCIE
jgi:hypothetical protein